MRVESPFSRRPFIRPLAWIAVGLAGLICISTVVFRFGRSPERVADTVPLILEKVAATADDGSGGAPSSPPPDEQSAEPPRRTGVDASGFYKDAFALFDQLTDEEKQMLSRPTEEVDADAARALFEKIQPIMELLRSAAAADFCDWGFGPLSADSPMPHVGKAQNLGKVALWNAAYRFPTEAKGAIGDLAARAKLGSHLSEMLIGLLVETSFEKSATNLLRQNAGNLDVATTYHAGMFLAESALDRDLVVAMEGETEFAKSALEKLAAQSADERVKLAKDYGLDSESAAPDQREAAQRLEQVLRDPVRFKAEMDFTAQAQAEMAEAMTSQGDRFAERWKELKTKTLEHPLAAQSLPVYEAIHARLEATRVQRAMLGAGLEILQNGPARLAEMRDPVTGRAFTYVPKPGGFELQSSLQVKGKPVTMSFARPE